MSKGNLRLEPDHSKRIEWSALMTFRTRWQQEGKCIVWTNGCFDLIHPGHVRSLRAARGIGDILVVGVNDDDSVRMLKGSGRPILTANARVEILNALECVDYIFVFNDLTPTRILEALQPDVHCKGTDYEPPLGKAIPEAEVVRAYGGRIEFIPLDDTYSTTKLIQQIRRSSSSDDSIK